MQKINFEDGQLVKKGYVEIDGTQYSTEEAEYDGATPLSAYVLNKMQANIEEAINNVQTLPAGGTTGQVLTKKSETYGDVKWSTVEGNEVYIGNEADAPATAKIVIDEDEQGWEDEGEIYSTTERKVGKWIDGKNIYRKVFFVNAISWNNNAYYIETNIDNIEHLIKMQGTCVNSPNGNFLTIPYINPSQISYQISLEYIKETNKIVLGSAGAFSDNRLTNCSIILEYTKTTDEEV